MHAASCLYSGNLVRSQPLPSPYIDEPTRPTRPTRPTPTPAAASSQLVIFRANSEGARNLGHSERNHEKISRLDCNMKMRSSLHSLHSLHSAVGNFLSLLGIPQYADQFVDLGLESLSSLSRHGVAIPLKYLHLHMSSSRNSDACFRLPQSTGEDRELRISWLVEWDCNQMRAQLAWSKGYVRLSQLRRLSDEGLVKETQGISFLPGSQQKSCKM